VSHARRRPRALHHRARHHHARDPVRRHPGARVRSTFDGRRAPPPDPWCRARSSRVPSRSRRPARPWRSPSGPAVGGLLIAAAGIGAVYAAYAVLICGSLAAPRLRARHASGGPARGALAARHPRGLSFVRRRRWCSAAWCSTCSR
jgi:hypothetical protein